MVDKLTFGCGEFLPGAGPFGFPDYVPSPGVDGPDDEDPGGGDFCEQDSDCWENPSEPESNVVCNTDTGVCQNVTTDPCDGVVCENSLFQVDTCKFCNSDNEGSCDCFQFCNDPQSDCYQQPTSCNCYVLYLLSKETVVVGYTSDGYILQVTYIFAQNC
jgi:hypothetical protein